MSVSGYDEKRVNPMRVSVFVRTSSLDAYEERLRLRGTETEEAIQRRLAGAREELTCDHPKRNFTAAPSGTRSAMSPIQQMTMRARGTRITGM